MRYLITLLLACMLSACATTDSPTLVKNTTPKDVRGPYKVYAYGNTVVEAKKLCFRYAVELAMGVAIQTEREIVNNEVAKNYILSHSSGFIESYKVLEVRQGNETSSGQFLVQMEVMIRPTIRDEYVLYSAKTNQKIDGDFLAGSISTYEDQRKSGDKLLMGVLKDYPEKALDIEIEPINFKMDDRNRYLYAEITYRLRYSDKYLQSLSQVLSQVKDRDCTAFCNGIYSFAVQYRKPGDKLLDTVDKYYFNDLARPELAYNYFGGDYFPQSTNSLTGKVVDNSRYAIKVDFLDKTKRVLNTVCYYSPNATKYKNYSGKRTEFGVTSEWRPKETFTIDMSKPKNRIRGNIDSVNNINVSVVKPHLCNDK